MYEYFVGNISAITPTYLVIETAGIGYRMHISLNTFTALQNKKEAKVFVHQVVKEDSNELFGFSDKAERSLFVLLISVSGVGAATAQVMLSAMGSKDIKEAIATGNVSVLQSIKGIGAKTAQRIILDLKDKILKMEGDDFAPEVVANSASKYKEEAVSALQMLGFKKPAVEKVVAKIVKAHPDSSVEEIIKLALKQL